MAAVSLTIDDLAPFADIPEAKAFAMIDDVIATAARVAPCILTEDFAHPGAALAILRSAVLRWHEAGSGALQTKAESIGNYSHSEGYDTRQTRRGLFWPSEIEQLQELCRDDDESSGIFAVDTLGTCGSVHADICALNFGALYCSCGAALTLGNPLYELP